MALADLSRFDPSKPISLRDISLRQGISLVYLEQLFLKLKRNKIANNVVLTERHIGRISLPFAGVAIAFRQQGEGVSTGNLRPVRPSRNDHFAGFHTRPPTPPRPLKVISCVRALQSGY